MKFYDFINEKNERVSKDEIITLLRTECNESWDLYIKSEKVLYRGESVNYDFFVKNSADENRKSANTINVYTPIINEHPTWSKFPKRNIICSSSYSYANGFGNVYYVFLYNGTKLGFCVDRDIWTSFVNIDKFDYDSARDFNGNISNVIYRYFSINISSDTLSELKNKTNNIKINDVLDIEKKYNDLVKREIRCLDFLKRISKNYKIKTIYDVLIIMYDPLNFYVGTCKDIKSENKQEIWFDGKAVFVLANALGNIMKEVRNK